MVANDKRSSLFWPSISDEEKMFFDIETWMSKLISGSRNPSLRSRDTVQTISRAER